MKVFNRLQGKKVYIIRQYLFIFNGYSTISFELTQVAHQIVGPSLANGGLACQ